MRNIKRVHFLLRTYRAWDHDPDVGLILAGSVYPLSKAVEMSRDYGRTFTALPEMPYGPSGIGQDAGVFGACLAIVDSNTIFVAGGRNNIPGKLHQKLANRLLHLQSHISV